MYNIQSILFDKKIYTQKQAIDFLIKNNYKHNKIDITKNHYRFRQIEPSSLSRAGYNKIVMKKIADGIEMIIYYQK
jgi:hypothetical protein